MSFTGLEGKLSIETSARQLMLLGFAVATSEVAQSWTRASRHQTR